MVQFVFNPPSTNITDLTSYKCIAKFLANRLKLIMPDIIDQNQSVFVKGRSISDNILLAQELFRGL